jgi:Carboxypeptidase regulatory-like domain/FG-GAP-like repeat
VATTTTTSGVYTFSNIATGSYYVRTNAPTGAGGIPYINQLYNGVVCLNSCSVLTNVGTTRVNVSSGAVTNGINFTLQRGGVITGTIIATVPNVPISGAGAQVFNSAGVSVGTFTTNNQTGVYTTTGLPAGTYYVRTANTRTYIGQLWQGQSCPQSGCIVTSGTPIVVNGATVSGIDFGLATGGTITGNVKDATNNSNLPNLAVQIFSNTGASLGSVNTDSSGNYTTTGLPAGTYYARTSSGIVFLPNNTSVAVVDQQYNGITCVPLCLNPTAGTPISVTTFALTSGINFSLSRGGVITGSVIDANTGVGLGSVSVQIYTDTGVFAKSSATNAAGGYTVAGLPPGTYFARTSVGAGVFYLDALFHGAQCSNGCTVTSGTPITVLANTASNGVDFALTTGAGGITGTVTDLDTGLPLSGVNVDIYSSTGVLTKFAITNAAGVYAASGLAPGTFFARTRQNIPTGHANQLYSNAKCPCLVTTGTPILVVAGALTPGIDFALGASVLTTKADFDGDGKTDISIFRPASGTWYVHNSSNNSLTSLAWGSGVAPYNDIQVPGDYDGDGKTDIAI